MKKWILIPLLLIATLSFSFKPETVKEKHTIVQKHYTPNGVQTVSITVEVNSEFSHTISWVIDFGGEPQFGFSIPYFYGNKANHNSYYAVSYVRYYETSSLIPTEGSVTINPWASNPKARSITYGCTVSVNNAIPWQPSFPETTWGETITVKR